MNRLDYKFRTKVVYSSLAAMIIFSISVPDPVLGISDRQKNLFNNNVLYYDLDASETCEQGGPAAGGSLTGVRFPKLDDTTVLAKAIDEYIKKGWPGSPLVGYGEKFVKYGQQYDVNPTIPVVIAQVEYQFGTLKQYVGPGAPGQYNFWAVTHGSTPGVRFGAYPSIDEAMEDHFKLLGGKHDSAKNGITYIGPPQNFKTVKQIMNQYAPAFENDTPAYINTILDGMRKLVGNAGANGNTSSQPEDTADSCSDDGSNKARGSPGLVSADGYAFPIAAKNKKPLGP
jgi:hypothetical protein